MLEDHIEHISRASLGGLQGVDLGLLQCGLGQQVLDHLAVVVLQGRLHERPPHTVRAHPPPHQSEDAPPGFPPDGGEQYRCVDGVPLFFDGSISHLDILHNRVENLVVVDLEDGFQSILDTLFARPDELPDTRDVILCHGLVQSLTTDFGDSEGNDDSVSEKQEV